MLIVGIDPGFTGAIAFLDPGSNTLTVHDMPTAPSVRGRVELDLNQLGSILIPAGQGRTVSMLEKVHAMPNQGSSSTFRFGQGYGAIEMALVGHGWERHYVTPKTWKKHFGLSSDKGVSRALASQRFPNNTSDFSLVKHDGRAEAALLALYVMEKVIGVSP